MSLLDYVPHRMLINRSLRKAATELRMRVDEYQTEYERRVAECDLEIQETEVHLTEEREIVHAMLDKEFKEAEGELSLVHDSLVSYVNLYLDFKCLRKIKEIKKGQVGIHKENIAFLGNQMKLIGEEVEILEARKVELISLASIDDIVELANMTPPGFNLGSNATCKELLDRITTLLCELSDDRFSEISALRRLRVIVQERSYYADVITYIEWVIRQKKQLSEQLSVKRRDAYAALADASSLLDRLKQEINENDRELNRLARLVRMHWIRPITYLSADISYAYQQKRDAVARLKVVCENIDHMRRIHSSDQWEWDNLQCERESLGSEIDDQQEIIDEKKTLRREWHDRRCFITRLCGANNVPLRSDGNRGRRDQMWLIGERLNEINQIRICGNAEAEERYEEERRDILQERNARLQEINDQISAIEDEIRVLESTKLRLNSEFEVASQNLKAAQKSDTRFVLFRMLADSDEVTRAKSALTEVQSRLDALDAKESIAVDAREDKKAELAGTTSDYEKKLSRCRPCYLRPNAEEKLEEKKLQLLKREFEDGR